MALEQPTETTQSAENRFDLTALLEFSSIINSSLDLKFILGHLLLTVMGKLLAARGIVLLEQQNGIYAIETVKGLDASLVGRTLKVNAPPLKFISPGAEDGRKFPWIKFFKEHSVDLIVPLIARDRVLGIAGFGFIVKRKQLSEKEETYAKSLANIAAAAIEKGLVFTELSHVNRRLDGKNQELNTLFELGKEFSAVLDPDRLVKLLVYSIMGQVGVTKYIIGLMRHSSMEIAASRLDRQLNPEVYGYMQSITNATLVHSLVKKSDRRLRELLQEVGIQALVPLQVQGETKGILGLGDKVRGGGYSPTDLEFLSSLGNLAMISLENARLFKETVEKQKMEDELLIAKEIQRGLLPSTLPNMPHFDLAAVNISSKQVGGDYYDIIALGDGRFAIAIGDVSGKGTPASLLMANLQATIRALIPLGLSLSELTKRVNDLICENTSSGRFITFFWGVLDTNTRTLRYVSAGHNPPFLFHCDGRVERLDKGGLILGIMKALVPYDEGEAKFSNDDVLVLFTDGVSEAMNAKGEEFEEERIEAVTKAHINESSGAILTSIVEAVKDHARNVPQSDDITLVIVKALA
jgi:sigma-B regulation protein RsbU (phosphoserine phosphatase)